jgi:hypothetical protein
VCTYNNPVIRTAYELHARGCHASTALWIAIKYDGCGAKPGAALMAKAAMIPKRLLISMEQRDLKLIDYTIRIIPPFDTY